MNTTNRIILNTVILYVKIIIVMVINLWTVPLLLNALGQSDYGLYQLVAGVVLMLTFINASMTLSTQRYMSVAMGKSDNESLSTQYVELYLQNDSSYFRNRYNVTPSKNWEFQNSLSYTERLSKFSFLVFRYMYRYSNRTSERSLQF